MIIAVLLALGGRVDPDAATVLALRAAGIGEAFIHSYDTRGERSWYSLAYGNEDSLIWFPGQAVEAVLEDGSTARAIELCAVTEEGRRIDLSRGARLARDEVKRKRFRRGAVCSVLFAGFRFGIEPDSIAFVRVAMPSNGRTPRVP